MSYHLSHQGETQTTKDGRCRFDQSLNRSLPDLLLVSKIRVVIIWGGGSAAFASTIISTVSCNSGMTSEVSASTPTKVFEMKSRNIYVPMTHFLL
jgi:hypothetical protein